MAIITSNKGEIQKALAEIHSRLAPAAERAENKQIGIQRTQIGRFEKSVDVSTYRIPSGSISERSQQNDRSVARSAVWLKVIERLKVPKIYHDASLAKIETLDPMLAKIGKEWISKPKSLYLSGCTGCGKTYFSYALLRGLYESCNDPNLWVFWKHSFDLDNQLLKAGEEGSEIHQLSLLCEVPFLFIDDLAVERSSERIIRQYYKIIDYRINNMLPMIFTSNLEMEKIGHVLGDRIASRLEFALEIKFPKRDLRKQKKIIL